MATTPKQYRMPLCPYLDRGPRTEKLYKLEEHVYTEFRAAATELGKVLGLEDFWTEALPEALFNFLEHWDRQAVDVAVRAYALRRGYKLVGIDDEK